MNSLNFKIMKNLKMTIIVLAMVGTLIVLSCKDNKKSEENQTMEMTNDTTATTASIEKISYNIEGSERTSEVVSAYLKIKDALVADDSDSAMEAGKMALKALENFDISNFSTAQQEKLEGIIDIAKENIKHISGGSIKDQRVYFKQLSINIENMIAIAGTDHKLYQLYCPMYEKGSSWLSAEKDIKNPYYGSKMLTCGIVKKEIN